jgi:hypothetical protein
MAILSNEYFQQRFGGDRSLIGKPLPVSNAFGPPPLLVGVLAPGFELLFPPQANMEQFPSVWLAARIPYNVANRNNVQWRAIGRLKPGVTMAQAQAEAETIAQKIRDENTIANTAGQAFRLVPMKQHLVDEVRPTILALMGAVIFLLLIACANVANLMLVRAASRERELAVRAALGAGWWQLIRQTLAEALVIAAIGTAIGVGLAYLGIRQLLWIAPANLPRLNAIGIDGQVLAFSVLAGLLSAVLFGVVPALRTAKPNLMDTLRVSAVPRRRFLCHWPVALVLCAGVERKHKMTRASFWLLIFRSCCRDTSKQWARHCWPGEPLLRKTAHPTGTS